MLKKESFKEVFLHEKPALILIALGENEKTYASNLAKKADCTYSHTVKILDNFQRIGLVEFKKKGRIKYITLTKQGKELADDLRDVHRKLKSI